MGFKYIGLLECGGESYDGRDKRKREGRREEEWIGRVREERDEERRGEKERKEKRREETRREEERREEKRRKEKRREGKRREEKRREERGSYYIAIFSEIDHYMA